MLSPALRHARANSGLTFRPDANCVLWLPGQDDAPSATIRDRSGSGNNGTITGATWTRLPSGLWGLSFDGSNDVVTITDSASLDITAAISLLAWVKPNGNQEQYAEIIAKQANMYNLRFGAALAMLPLLSISGTLRYDATGYSIINGVFTFLCLTWDGTDGYMRTYGNAVLKHTSAQYLGAIDTSASNLTIGARSTTERRYKGIIALPRVYNQALSAPEIAGIYNQERHLFGV